MNYEFFTGAKQDEIIKLEALGANSIIYLHNNKNKKIISTKSLKYFSNKLPVNFIKIHKKTIINKLHIKAYYYGRGGYVVLSDGSSNTVSVRLKPSFLRILSK